jgi:hypothetical protein
MLCLLAQFVDIDKLAGRDCGDCPRQRERMPRSDHRRDRLLALLGIRGRSGERPDPAPLGEAERRFDRLSVGMVARRGAVFLADPCNPQFVIEAALAIAAAAERLRLRQRISRVVDIAELAKALREPLELGFARAAPPPLADLAREIGAKLRARRRVAADIAKRELLQPPGVERRPLPEGPLSCHCAVFVPHSPLIRNRRRRKPRGRKR